MKWILLATAFLTSSHLFAVTAKTDNLIKKMAQEIKEKIDDGQVSRADLTPLLIGGLKINRGLDAQNKEAYVNLMIAELKKVLRSDVIYCDECESNAVREEQTGMSYILSAPTASEIRAFDKKRREQGLGVPSRAVIFAYVSDLGISFRIQDQGTARVLVAASVGSDIDTESRSVNYFSVRREFNRNARGDYLNHTFYDLGMFPSPHVGINWLEQWGPGNEYFTGFTMSLVSPIMGIGGAAFRALPSLGNALVGGKILISLPKILEKSSGSSDTATSGQTYDVMGMIRYPIGQTSVGVIGYISTSAIGVGLSF